MSARIHTRKKPWFQFLFRHYVKRRLKKQFSDIRLLGASHFTQQLDAGPVIVACNHVAWWDPLVLVRFEAWLQADGYCLMDADNLKELPFFNSLGALPLDRKSRRQSYRDMLASLEQVRVPRQLLFIFPQGKQTPAHHRLEFHDGVSLLAQRSGLPIVPLGLRYDFAEGPRQIVHVALGAPLSWTASSKRRTFTQELETAVAGQLAKIDEQLLMPKPEVISLLGRRLDGDQKERVPLLAASLRKISPEPRS